MSDTAPPLLSIEGLGVEFRTRAGIVHALDDVSWIVRSGETVGVVGESGSGKSVTAYAVMGLLDHAAKVRSGRIMFEQRDLLAQSERELRKMRGRDLGMIFQNPRSALNPIRTIGAQIADVLICNAGIAPAAARQRTIEVLALVKIADPEGRLNAYPFELSGGMCQRVMIALALACEPALLIADEPTTGLDVTTQAAVLDLVAELAVGRAMATVLITHDLALAAEYCDRIVVMHAGHVVEIADTVDLFARPFHPYTRRLIAATPRRGTRLDKLEPIPGGIPDLRRPDLPPCRYRDRCERAASECDIPPLPVVIVGDRHSVACRRAS